MSPISDASRRCCGHRLAGSRKWREACRIRIRFDPSSLDRRCLPPLAAWGKRKSRRLPSCRNRPGSLRIAQPCWRSVKKRFAGTAHTVLTFGAAAACVSTRCGDLLGQRPGTDSPCGLPSVVARDALDRLLPSHVFDMSTHAPSGFRRVRRGRHLRLGETILFHVRTIRFGGPHIASSPRALSSQGGVCEPCL